MYAKVLIYFCALETRQPMSCDSCGHIKKYIQIRNMQENLVIVESPAKAKTIEKFLGKDFKVMSSYGHIRDLKRKR